MGRQLLGRMVTLLQSGVVILTLIQCTQAGYSVDGVGTSAVMKLVQDMSGVVRVKRQACDQEGSATCIQIASQTYMDLMWENDGEEIVAKAVPEGEKPDYYERKSCNFILEAEKCFDKLKNCGIPADTFKQIKDKSMKDMRDSAAQFENWDEAKCKSNSGGNSSAVHNACLNDPSHGCCCIKNLNFVVGTTQPNTNPTYIVIGLRPPTITTQSPTLTNF